MAEVNETASQFIESFKRLSASEVLGFYNCCEVTEIFALQPDQSIVNVFSLFVFEEHETIPKQTPPKLLTKKLIPSSSDRFKGFGICRYYIDLQSLHKHLKELTQGHSWKPNSKEIILGSMVFTRPFFAPPDATLETPINGLLKNNFWNGSHVLELFDQSKTHFKHLLDKPSLLQELSEKIQLVVPIKLASLSDRLGNVVLQFPISILRTQFRFSGDAATKFDVAWDNRIEKRSLIAISTAEFDSVYRGFAVQEISLAEARATIKTGDSTGITKTYLWDTEHNVLLAASGELSAMRQMYLNSRPMGPEPRQIVIPAFGDNNKSLERISISASDLSSTSLIGDKNDEFEYRDHINSRRYSKEQALLLKSKDFVQYGKHLGRGYDEAIGDIRVLINRFGTHGVWLWDPFLDSIDIMQTLFFCNYGGVDLRALGESNKKTRDQKDYKHDQLEVWKSEQRANFNTEGNNHHGLRLEFRLRHGNVGFSFHDRFLIFPRKDQEARVYSLGTSVNSLGKDHHILQRVSHGGLVADAFQGLWEQLDHKSYLVWKRPQ